MRDNPKKILQSVESFRGNLNYIKFPNNRDETARAVVLFQDVCKIPQALRAIDGTNFEVIAAEEPFDYFDL